MGAMDFQDSSWAKTAEKAYAQAVEQAHYDYGHDPYNGTISTTEGFRMVRDKPVTMEEAEEIMREETDNFHKWCECGCLQIADQDKDGDHRFVFFGLAAS